MKIEEILHGESKNMEFKARRPEKSIKYMIYRSKVPFTHNICYNYQGKHQIHGTKKAGKTCFEFDDFQLYQIAEIFSDNSLCDEAIADRRDFGTYRSNEKGAVDYQGINERNTVSTSSIFILNIL